MDLLLCAWNCAKYFICGSSFNPHYNYYCYYSHFTDVKLKFREVKSLALDYSPSCQLLELEFEPNYLILEPNYLILSMFSIDA